MCFQRVTFDGRNVCCSSEDMGGSDNSENEMSLSSGLFEKLSVDNGEKPSV